MDFKKDAYSFMIENALISHKSEYTDVIEDISQAVSYGTIRVMLKYAGE